uniref:Uncharacterized protein n=1 Tax=Ciona savignyi TaxID=51511 RepID=H2YJ05_CIOSA
MGQMLRIMNLLNLKILMTTKNQTQQKVNSQTMIVEFEDEEPTIQESEIVEDAVVETEVQI